MKVLIIEDEPQSLEGMRRMMERLDARIEQTWFCDHAADALDVIDDHRPELIVTDIILPDMTGLDLLEQIRITDYKPKIIIVSGFDDFEYAKRGMQLGAIDYFLKPFDTGQFRLKIIESLNLIEAERLERLSRHRAVEMANLGARSMRDSFLLGLCLQTTYLQEHIVHKLRTWGLEWLITEPYHVAAVAVKAFASEMEEKEEEILSFATGNITEELLQAFPPSVTFKNSKNHWIVLTPIEDIGPLLDRLGREVRTCQKQELAIGVSERASSFQSLHAAYCQAVDSLRAALLGQDPAPVFHERIKGHANGSGEDLAARMAAAVKGKDEEAIRDAADRFIRSAVMKASAVKSAEISQRCVDWVMKVHHALRDGSGRSVGEIPLAFWEELEDCGSMDDLSRALAHYFMELSLQLGGVSKNFIIEQALRLIHEKYAEDLKLQDLADELFIHPVWLSQLFKKEVGTNFLDYVTDLRIRKARELLRQSNLKIYEIALAVGYQDVHHFGRLFKKKTGVTPKEYRYGK